MVIGGIIHLNLIVYSDTIRKRKLCRITQVKLQNKPTFNQNFVSDYGPSAEMIHEYMSTVFQPMVPISYVLITGIHSLGTCFLTRMNHMGDNLWQQFCSIVF